jgi:hypothetical protein
MFAIELTSLQCLKIPCHPHVESERPHGPGLTRSPLPSIESGGAFTLYPKKNPEPSLQALGITAKTISKTT